MRFGFLFIGCFVASLLGSQTLYVANNGGTTVDLVDLAASLDPSGALTGFITPRELALTPDRRYLFVGDQNADTVSMFDASTNALIQTIGPTSANVLIGLVATDTAVYVAGNANRIVSMIDIASRSEVAAIDINPSLSGGNANELALSPDGTQVWGTNTGAATVFFFNTGTTTPAVTEIVLTQSGPNGIALTLDHAYVVNQGSDSLSKIDRTTLAETVISLMGFGVVQPQDIAISPDGATAYIVDLGTNALYFYDIATDAITGSVALPVSQNYGVIVSPDGSQVFVSHYSSNEISRYDVVSGVVTSSGAMYSMPLGMALLCPFPVSGSCKKDVFLTQIDLINEIQWSPILNTVPVSYWVYRNGSLIGTVSDPGPYRFSDPNRKKKTADVYTIYVRSSNYISFVGSITVPACK